MLQRYEFWGDGTIEFDDERTVRELICYAFDVFDYYEPMGMEIVTVCQLHSPRGNWGWFTTDTSRKCADELEPSSPMSFAYYLPGVAYTVEGLTTGELPHLSNRPVLEDPVCVGIRGEGISAAVIAGRITPSMVIERLKRAGYIPETAEWLNIFETCELERDIPFTDPRLREPLSVFAKHYPYARFGISETTKG